MREEILNAIRYDVNKGMVDLEAYNSYAEFRNQMSSDNEDKLILKSEADVIMSAYKKHRLEINSTDTNDIYVYAGSYMLSNSPDYLTCEDIENGAPYEVEVDINDPRVMYRRYWNLEGIWARTIAIDECEEFEKTHKVLYVDNFTALQQEFMTTAVKNSQEEAVSRVLKKYSRRKK